MATIRGRRTRQRSTPLGTPGRVELENGFASDTLELPWHGNQRGVSCTRAGIERGRVWWSSMLKRPVIRLDDRDGRFDCLWHNGNLAADARDLDGDGVPEETQVHGCTEMGDGYGEIVRRDGRKQWGIKGSVAALERLIASLRDRSVPDSEVGPGTTGFMVGYHEIEVICSWADGCSPGPEAEPAEKGD